MRELILVFVYLVIANLKGFLWDIKQNYVEVLTFFSELICMGSVIDGYNNLTDNNLQKEPGMIKSSIQIYPGL